MCLDDDDVARFVVEPPRSAWRERWERHIDGCAACRALVAVAMIDLSSDDARAASSNPAGLAVTVAGHREGDRVDRFVLLELLGEGGMGVVFAARETTTGEERALKLLKRVDAAAERRLLREARAAATIAHPAIVPVLDVVRDAGGAPALVMPRLRGQDLAALLAQGRRWSPSEVHPVVRALLDGLRAVHAAGAVHRDVKPSNVFLEDGGRVRLLDLGLVGGDTAQAQPGGLVSVGLTGTSALLGTTRYLAPEVVHGERADARADLWGVGHVAFELLTGRRVLEIHHPGDVYREMARSTPVRRVSDVDPRIPPGVADVVASLLERERSRRVVSATAALVVWDAAFAGPARSGT